MRPANPLRVIGRSPCFGLFLPVSTSEDIIFPFVTKFLPVADISEAVTGGGGCSIKKDVLKNFGKSTGKYLRQRVFLIKLKASVAGLRDSGTGLYRLRKYCYLVCVL